MIQRFLFLLCLSIVVLMLSGCFDPCEFAPPECVNGTCKAEGFFKTTCACDIGYEGEVCDAEIEVAPCDPPDCQPYDEILAGRLAPEGCQTYIAPHPLYPTDLFCCSAPSSGEAPACAPGDIGDIPCVVEFEFCEDGSASKAFSPDPKTGQPGHSVSTSGTWSIDPATDNLTITTTLSAMGGSMTMENIEIYPNAFTYDNGNRLDLESVSAWEINAGGYGLYYRHEIYDTVITGLWPATLEVDTVTQMEVTATGFSSRIILDATCSPSGSMVCTATPPSEETTGSGTHDAPLALYKTVSNIMMYQSDEARAMVFVRQPNACDGIDCGEHGSCNDGVCECTDGYIGDLCDVETSCVGVDCGENGTCVVEGTDGICVCDDGYEGDTCGTDINECDANPSPCLNGSSCEQGVPGTYECTCIDGYTGDNCERCPGDADGDGYGDPASSLCIHLELDCDDTHASVYPGAPELCDKLDNQCDGDSGFGIVDEGFTNCGDMVSISSGCFDMGDAFAEGWPDELPVHNVCLSDFEMDIHEITNAEYAECVEKGACTEPSSYASYTRTSYYDNPLYADYPVIWMWWDDVYNYCTWAGKRLPTEAEWEYAARGGLEGKRYPWGNWISSWRANYDFNVGDTSEVESYRANGHGLYDMAGNVWEWVADWYGSTYYSDSPANDPKGPANGSVHVRRGGSFDHSAFGLRMGNRCDFCHVDRHANNLGGRCAR